MDHPVLGQVALGYAPMIDRHRTVTAMRLTVFPSRPDRVPDVDDLLAVLAEAWPPEAGRLAINAVGEALVAGLLAAELPPHLMLEVPAFMAADADTAARVAAQYGRGVALFLKGRARQPLPRELLPCFAYALIDLEDERRDGLPPPGGVARSIALVQGGIGTVTQMTEAFGRGAMAVMGWPLVVDDAPAGKPAAPSAQLQAVMELIQRVDRAEPVARLEAVLKTEPTMAYRLMRYINSPAFGLRVEITSFGHAVMMLGYERLKRWLVLLLAAATRESDLKPLVLAAVRRGLVMEALGRATEADDEHCGELFICGVFSLLDRLLRQPMDRLLDNMPMSDDVRTALLCEPEAGGPLAGFLVLAQAVESGSLYDIEAAAEGLMLALPTVNKAVLHALRQARQLDL